MIVLDIPAAITLVNVLKQSGEMISGVFCVTLEPILWREEWHKKNIDPRSKNS